MRYSLLFCALLAFVSCEKENKDPKDKCKRDITKGLLAYYPFSGNFNDASGNGNHATSVNGAMLGTDMVGRQSSAAEFDGFNDYLIVNNSEKLNADTITVSCEVMIRTTGNRQALVNRLDFNTPEAFQWGLGQALETDNKYSFAVPPASEDCTFQPEYNPANSVFSDVIIEAGRWYNVVAIFEKGKQTIYIDGKLAGTVTRDFQTLKKCPTADLVIGGWWLNDIISLDGKLDEVRIYNRALNDCELTELAVKFIDRHKTD